MIVRGQASSTAQGSGGGGPGGGACRLPSRCRRGGGRRGGRRRGRLGAHDQELVGGLDELGQEGVPIVVNGRVGRLTLIRIDQQPGRPQQPLMPSICPLQRGLDIAVHLRRL